MFRRKKTVLFLLSLLGLQIGLQTNLLNGTWSAKRTISFATVAAAMVCIYKLGPQIYISIQDKIKTEVDEELVRCLVLMLTPNCFIQQLKGAERNIKFQKKARLTTSSRRVENRLKNLLESSTNRLSDNHKKELKETLRKTKLIFDSVGFIDSGMSFLIKNPFENDYKEPGYIDQIIENRIYESIILSSKPLNECTENEKLQRTNSKQSIKKLIVKRIGNIGEVLLEQINQVLDLLFS